MILTILKTLLDQVDNLIVSNSIPQTEVITAMNSNKIHIADLTQSIIEDVLK